MKVFIDSKTIRMVNYQTLMHEFSNRADQKGLSDHGFLKRFADHGGLSVRYLSHINNGRKPIGDQVARQMELGFDKPAGWLDREQELVESGGEKKMAVSRRLFNQAMMRSPDATMHALLSIIIEADGLKRTDAH